MFPDVLQSAGARQLQAIVLAGGYGNRLRTMIADVPKPMAPIGGRPFLSYVLDDLAEHGFRVVVLAVSWLHEVVVNVFGDRYRGMELRYSIEPKPLGTGGAIRQAFELVDEDFAFVLNGDTFQHLPYHLMLQLAGEERSDIVMAVRAVDDAARYGTVELHGSRVARFVEKRGGGPGLINAGAYLVQQRIVADPNLGGVFSFEEDVLLRRADSRIITACLIGGNFIDIGVPDDYVRAKAEIPGWIFKANR